MSQSSWDDYVAADPTPADTTGTTDGTTAPDAAAALDSAATADSWSDWNADTAQTFTDTAAGELDYAQQQYAAGWDDLGDAAVARAETALDSAAGYGSEAVDQAQSAVAWTDEATADQAYADAGSTADTTSYDTGSDEA